MSLKELMKSFPPGKHVAIKRMTMEFLTNVHETREKQKRSFDHEIQILSSFHHPNIVKLYGYVNTYDHTSSSSSSTNSSTSPEICLIFEMGQLGSVSSHLLDGEKHFRLVGISV